MSSNDFYTIAKSNGGTGHKLAAATIIVSGVASIVATILSVISILLQLKNYRKPLLQRYVVRILVMVPIYSISSWTSMVSLTASAYIDPIRDIYEAFTIYTFFQLLINYLGGERALIIMAHGRAPVQHLWPLNHVLPKVDISDPHTFLSIKRGILQYAWLKPILALSTIIMKATETYQEGYIGTSSGYLWSGIVYNISVSVSLYSLGLFWVCMHKDLTPFRPVPKFLCIKLIIFASYWQGFFLSILVFLGAIPDDEPGYTPDNIAAAIQDALICVEMPAFAIAHLYAFSWKDFADNSILSARMPLRYAMRDAFGIRDLIEDSKETFRGDNYGYRVFDSGDKVMAHEDSKSRLARLREGMRYERGGKGKYWIPKPGEAQATTPLLGSNGSPGPSTRPEQLNDHTNDTVEEPEIDAEEEDMYAAARELEFGDWNYPVITASEPLSERYLSHARNASRAHSYQPVQSPQSPASRPSLASRRQTHTSQSSQSSQSSHSRHESTPQRQSEDPPVIPVKKKKKKPKKTIQHEVPDASQLKLNQDAPSSRADQVDGHQSPGHAEAASRTSAASSSRPQAGQQQEPREVGEETGYFAGYQVEENEEFRNVWGKDTK